jgi:putative restriction endonuclease
LAKAIFTYKSSSIYDDLPEERYHFPRTYLRQVESAVGDLILYYEPGRTGLGDGERTGRRSYVAVAKVARVERDPRSDDHFYAHIAPGSFFVLDRPVPFREGGRFYESALRRGDGLTSKGAFGRAVRTIPDAEFDAILAAGFARELTTTEAEWDLPSETWGPGLQETQLTFERPVVEQVLNRKVRDAAFTRAVREAYAATCAVTGLRLTNGRDRPEVQAAHIRSVEHDGPDSVRNGIALSSTFHWMFDRGLIGIGPPPRFEVLVTGKGLPEAVLRMINPTGRLRVPDSPLLQPARVFLDWHRKNVFDRRA